jgi:hypothetical protein
LIRLRLKSNNAPALAMSRRRPTVMQVSWINPEDVAALAESLRPAKPETLLSPATGLCLLTAEEEPVEESADTDAAPSADTSSAMPAVTPPGDSERPSPIEPAAPESTPATPDLDALRQRLHEIRVRAVDAGLLPGRQNGIAPTEAISAVDSPQEPVPVGAPLRQRREFTPFQVPLGSVMARVEAFAQWLFQSLGTSNVFVIDDRGNLLWGPQEQAGLVLSTLMAINAASRGSAASACEKPQINQQVLPSGMMMTAIPCETRLGDIQVAVAAPDVLAAHEAEMIREALQSAMNGPQ